MAASLLDDEQRAALERARQGDHLPLAERGYSTGATVVRRVPLGRASPQAFNSRQNANAGLVNKRRSRRQNVTGRNCAVSSQR
eukprot:1107501-Prymnesium_polylepis.2